jgi:hypothetical protein
MLPETSSTVYCITPLPISYNTYASASQIFEAITACYEGEPVNRSQMDIKHKNVIF